MNDLKEKLFSIHTFALLLLSIFVTMMTFLKRLLRSLVRRVVFCHSGLSGCSSGATVLSPGLRRDASKPVDAFLHGALNFAGALQITCSKEELGQSAEKIAEDLVEAPSLVGALHTLIQDHADATPEEIYRLYIRTGVTE